MCALLCTFTDLKLIKGIFDMNTLLCSVLAWNKQLQIDTAVLHTQRRPSYFTCLPAPSSVRVLMGPAKKWFSNPTRLNLLKGLE